jgi:hypothetical protein
VGINLADLVTQWASRPVARVMDAAGDDVVTLRADQHIEVPALVLPPAAARRAVGGTVEWADGRPRRGVLITAREVDRESLSSVDLGWANASGRFRLTLYEGRSYILEASEQDPRSKSALAGETYPPIAVTRATLTVDGDRDDVRLIFTAERQPQPQAPPRMP